VKSIHWDDRFVDHERFTEVEMAEIYAKCNNVDSFSFGHADAEPWLKIFGKRVETLAINRFAPWKNNLSAVSYCTNIRELTLVNPREKRPNISNIWKDIGSSLEVIRYKNGDIDEIELGLVQKYCRKLKHIDINRNSNTHIAGYAQFLASY